MGPSAERIRKVTPEQIKAVAARYLAFDRSTTGYLLPKTENQEMTVNIGFAFKGGTKQDPVGKRGWPN